MSRPTESPPTVRVLSSKQRLRDSRPSVSLGASLALCGILTTLGCGQSSGPPRVAVAGEVLLDGTPLVEGMIRFIPESGVTGPATAGRIENGQFSLGHRDGPVVGRHRVEIEATNHHPFPIDDERAFASAFARNPRMPLAQNPVPATYNERSTLTAEIAPPGPEHLSFHLNTNPKTPQKP